jgi:hypothetical protein
VRINIFNNTRRNVVQHDCRPTPKLFQYEKGPVQEMWVEALIEISHAFTVRCPSDPGRQKKKEILQNSKKRKKNYLQKNCVFHEFYFDSDLLQNKDYFGMKINNYGGQKNLQDFYRFRGYFMITSRYVYQFIGNHTLRCSLSQSDIILRSVTVLWASS